MAEINFIIISACLIMMNFSDSMATSGDSCPKGTYYDNTDCKLCPEGTFMPVEDHKRTACHECTQIMDPSLEILITECNKTLDADIQCVDDYYRVLPRNPRQKAQCRKCDSCLPFMYQIRKCQNYSNTWCCSDVNYDYEYDVHGVALCRERAWMCRRGEYLDSSVNDCKPCPKDTFMPEDYHSHTLCWPCPYLSEADYPLHSVIIQKCNSTHPPIFRCKGGFYINHDLGYRGRNIGCSPCSSCQGSYVGRQCDTFNDTICCPRPFMTVDVTDGVTCIELKTHYQQNRDNEGKRIDFFLNANNEADGKPGSQGPESNFNIRHFFGGVATGVVLCALIVLAIWLVRSRVLVHRRRSYNNVDKENNRDVQEILM